MKKEELISEIQKACNKFWEDKGAKIGKIQTVADINTKSNLDILDKKPETKFLVKGVTLRTRGYEMVCELDIHIIKPDGKKRLGANVFSTVWIGAVLEK